MIQALPLPEKYFKEAIKLGGDYIIVTIEGDTYFKTNCYAVALTPGGILFPLLDSSNDELELLTWRLNKWAEYAYSPQLINDAKHYEHGYRIEYDLKELTVTINAWKMVKRNAKPITTKLIKRG